MPRGFGCFGPGRSSSRCEAPRNRDFVRKRRPAGVEAAIDIVSILWDERPTQREVAGVTEVTIRNRYKELTERLGIRIEL